MKLYLEVTCKKKEDTIFKNWFNSMYFSELHALYIDGFMEIAYATLLTMQEG